MYNIMTATAVMLLFGLMDHKDKNMSKQKRTKSRYYRLRCFNKKMNQYRPRPLNPSLIKLFRTYPCTVLLSVVILMPT